MPPAREADGIPDPEEEREALQRELDAVDELIEAAGADCDAPLAQCGAFASGDDERTGEAVGLLAAEPRQDDILELRRQALKIPFGAPSGGTRASATSSAAAAAAAAGKAAPAAKVFVPAVGSVADVVGNPRGRRLLSHTAFHATRSLLLAHGLASRTTILDVGRGFPRPLPSSTATATAPGRRSRWRALGKSNRRRGSDRERIRAALTGCVPSRGVALGKVGEKLAAPSTRTPSRRPSAPILGPSARQPA
jgi:hypothetical protein